MEQKIVTKLNDRCEAYILPRLNSNNENFPKIIKFLFQTNFIFIKNCSGISHNNVTTYKMLYLFRKLQEQNF